MCVVSEAQETVCCQRPAWARPEKIPESPAQRTPFHVVGEAAGGYEWFVRLAEPLAERVVLADPEKLWAIAEGIPK